MNGDMVTDTKMGSIVRAHRLGEMIMAVTKLISPYDIVEFSDNKL